MGCWRYKCLGMCDEMCASRCMGGCMCVWVWMQDGWLRNLGLAGARTCVCHAHFPGSFSEFCFDASSMILKGMSKRMLGSSHAQRQG